MDNSFGSGSFLLAAALENRKFCGIELNQNAHLFKQSDNVIDYIDFAKKRLDEVGIETKVARAK